MARPHALLCPIGSQREILQENLQKCTMHAYLAFSVVLRTACFKDAGAVRVGSIAHCVGPRATARGQGADPSWALITVACIVEGFY
eukprot:1194675-Prorocentrum_minimum.AAC.2